MFKFFLCCSRAPDDTYEVTRNRTPPRKYSRKGSVATIATGGKSEWTKQTANSLTHHYHSRNSITDSGENKGFILDNKFQVFQIIGQGSFGKVYHAKDIHTGEPVAIKMLKHKGHQSYFRETSVLKHLAGADGVPQILWEGKHESQDCIALTRLGYDLSMLFEYCDHAFSLPTVLKLGIELVTLMQTIHDKGILHRDIKPHNFLIGYKENRLKLYVIDFGLAKSYISKDKRHKRFAKGLQPVGTARYASFWTHMGVSQSRRDDLLSIGYILIYFLKGRLPWQGLRIRSKEEKWSKIGYVKMSTSIETLCEGLPKQFIDYIEYIAGLPFESKPDYDRLKKLFTKTAEENQIDLEKSLWDWESNFEDSLQQSIKSRQG